MHQGRAEADCATLPEKKKNLSHLLYPRCYTYHTNSTSSFKTNANVKPTLFLARFIFNLRSGKDGYAQDKNTRAHKGRFETIDWKVC